MAVKVSTDNKNINQTKQSINDYWIYTVKQMNIATATISLFEAALVGVILYFLTDYGFGSVLFWAIIFTLVIVFMVINGLIFRHILQPFKDILAAASKSTGENVTSLTAPNINSKKYKNTGLATALSFIYGQKSAPDGDTKESSPDMQAATQDILQSLNRMETKIITFDVNGDIAYATKGAPINIKSGGVKEVSLLFSGADTLERWMENCKQNKVNAIKMWKRVPDQLPGQEDRRIFDVYANFQKDSPHETVLTLVDRTATYEPDEEALDFIAFAAHELRGPITVIRGYIDVLHDELDDILVGDQNELFKRLEVSANKLSGYINNILNTSRYDRRHLKINLAKDSFLSIYRTIEDDMQLRASLQGRRLNVNIPHDLPQIAADRTSLSEAMSNLIDNAIKYSHEGGTVSVSAYEEGSFVKFSVQDNGIGMPSNVLANLFQKFYRSHRSRETVAGTGIGLYISRAIAEAHGGTITVKSEEGKGSTFIITIPTYASVESTLNNQQNINLTSEGGGWIKNHGMYRG